MVGITAFGVMWLGPEHLRAHVSAREAPGAERGACLSAPREFRENCGIPEISWKSPEESAKLRSVASGVQNVRLSLKFRDSKPKRAKTAHRRRASLCRHEPIPLLRAWRSLLRPTRHAGSRWWYALLDLNPEIDDSSADPAAKAVQRRRILSHSKLSQLQIGTPGIPIF